MNLSDLIGKKIEKITPHQDTIKRLLAAAERNIIDSKVTAVSPENRFDSGYKAIMQIANAALQANGYRTLTSKPGHHHTMIQALPETIGTQIETVIILDSMRKQRNIADYSGDIVPESAVKECISQAEDLLKNFKAWLAVHHPELLA